MGKSKTKTREERLKAKRECEQRRRERIKQDAEKSKTLKEKKHEIYMRAKESKKIKMINDMSEREKRQIRKKWRENTRQRRQRQKASVQAETFCANTTPPYSDSDENQQQPLISPEESSQKKRGRKLVRRDRAAAYRKIKKLEVENKCLRKGYQKYKKRWQRLLLGKGNKTDKDLTPNSKVRKMLKGNKVNESIRKRLVFTEALSRELTQTFKSLKSQKERQIFTKIINGKIVKKYRVLGYTKDFLPKKLFLANARRINKFSYERLPSNSKAHVRSIITKFWEDEEHTTVCPGKKDFVKKNGVQKQKRYLNDTIKNMHAVFLKTQPINMSYPVFCRLKPFWVVTPQVNNRDTCLCIRHENFKLFTQKLHKQGIINEKTPHDIVKVLTCPDQKEACFKRTCNECENNNVPYLEFIYDNETCFEKWMQKNEKFTCSKTNKEKTVKLLVKEKIQSTNGDIVKMFEAMQLPFLDHILNIKHQFQTIKSVKENLKESDLFLHIDFSENYKCKYSAEPQSVHFGASRKQITLHTGMIYGKDFKEGFCTMSSSLLHNPEAITAHLKMTLIHYLKHFPNVTTLHFLSDTPSTQYRNKTMFFFIYKRIPQLFPAIDTIIWNYSEAGHGKGAPDGIGGALKRTADRTVAEGKDINNFETLYNTLKEKTNIFLLNIENTIIKEEQDWLHKENPNLSTVKGTHKVHQVCWSRFANAVMFRSLSCYKCKPDVVCKQYHLKSLMLEQNDQDVGSNSFATHLTRKSTEVRPVGVIQQAEEEELSEGSWVAVIFDDEWYPGCIERRDETYLSVSFMHKSGGRFYWPTSPDVQTVEATSILCRVDTPPYPVSNRHYEMTKQVVDSIDCLFSNI